MSSYLLWELRGVSLEVNVGSKELASRAGSRVDKLKINYYQLVLQVISLYYTCNCVTN